MQDYLAKIKHEEPDSISICFYIEQDKIIEIGDKMNEMNEEAYMNGYNWDAFIDYYLRKNNPELLEGLETDPEAGMYCAYYKQNADNEQKADQLIAVIENLIENESALYELLKNEGKHIEWD